MYHSATVKNVVGPLGFWRSIGWYHNGVWDRVFMGNHEVLVSSTYWCRNGARIGVSRATVELLLGGGGGG